MSMVRLPYSIIFTARKRNLRRLYFYTCLSVILFTGEGCCVSLYAMGQTNLQEDTPPRKTDHPGRQIPPRKTDPPPKEDTTKTPQEHCMPGDTGKKRAGRILLEWILGLRVVKTSFLNNQSVTCDSYLAVFEFEFPNCV